VRTLVGAYQLGIRPTLLFGQVSSNRMRHDLQLFKGAARMIFGSGRFSPLRITMRINVADKRSFGKRHNLWPPCCKISERFLYWAARSPLA
jgi:hypothetical protein